MKRAKDLVKKEEVGRGRKGERGNRAPRLFCFLEEGTRHGKRNRRLFGRRRRHRCRVLVSRSDLRRFQGGLE